MIRRRAGSHDSRKYYDWLDHAGEDMIAAELLSRDDRCFNAAAFHCQQAIEKALKAYILLRTHELVDGHNLTWLCRQAKKYEGSFEKWMEESASLNRCYIETRYPADIQRELGDQQVQEFYKTAKEMFLFICTEVDGFLDEQEENSQSPQPQQP